MNSRPIKLSKNPIFKFMPAFLMMIAIFLFSAGSAVEMPEHSLEMVINKGGHMLGYGILALAYWRIFDLKGNRLWLAWLLTVLYALTDELHQSFVPGRHPSLYDVMIYDNLGALITLWLAAWLIKFKQTFQQDLVVEEKRLDAKK